MGAVVAMAVLLSEDWNDNAPKSHSGPQLLASWSERLDAFQTIARGAQRRRCCPKAALRRH